MKAYVMDAFSEKLFGGNQAGVALPERPLSDAVMQQIAAEFKHSETAFVTVNDDGSVTLRYFTPAGEVDLCGHATLGTACAIMTFVAPELTEITFTTLSGDLTVVRRGDLYEMDFPAYELKSVPVTQAMADAMNGAMPKAAYMGRDLLCVFDDEETVRHMTVDQEKVRALDGLLLHATAPGKDVDCVSRSFAPKCNVAEDPVCGSGHCHIVPYWVKALGKDSLVAYQASPRGGTLYCTQMGDRIKMSGKAAVYSVADINIG